MFRAIKSTNARKKAQYIELQALKNSYYKASDWSTKAKIKKQYNIVKQMFIPHSTYTTMTILISNLKKIGLEKDDIVIIAVDSKLGSWRRDLLKSYKEDRAAKRKQDKFVNYKEEFKRYDWLKDCLEKYSPFHVLDLSKLESDDIIAYCTKYYKNHLCCIMSYDHDFNQLLTRDNVRIFSPHPKAKIPYKILDLNRDKERIKAFKELGKMINHEDELNLKMPVPYELRKKVVDLLHLPKWVEKKIKEKLDNLVEKPWQLDKMPYQKLMSRVPDIYNKSKIITYESCRKKLEKKKNRR